MAENYKETRAEAMHRLIAEGRWDEATAYRNKTREQIRAGGEITRREARDAAWEAMLQQYPPLDADEIDRASASEQKSEGSDMDDLPEQQLDELLERTDGQEVDLVRDVLWVYENLENTNASLDAAPSVGAWGLLQWSRRYRNHFFEKMLPKALTVKEKREQDPESELIRQEEANLGRLKKHVHTLMEGQRQTFCEHCWTQLQENASDLVEVRHHGQSLCLRCQGVLGDKETDVCRDCVEELAGAYGVVGV